MTDCDDSRAKIEYLRQHIVNYPNFPKSGVLFRDVFALFRNPTAFRILKTVLIDYTKTIGPPLDVIVGLESKGFILGPIIALEMGLPFIPIRKKGKLPGKVASIDYTLEYGKETFEIQTEESLKGARALIVDDVLATGGTLGAACNLLERSGAKVVCCLVIIELIDLKGGDKVNAPIHTLLRLNNGYTARFYINNIPFEQIKF